MGTCMEIIEISHAYEDGKLDIKTHGTSVFKILEIVKKLPEKSYSGAIVNYPDNSVSDGNPELMKKIVSGIRKIHKRLNISKEFVRTDQELLCYDVAHHAGMAIEDEYHLLHIYTELQRQEFLKRHISKILPVLTEMEALKKRIKLNGHFKNLGGFNFSL